MKTPSFHDRRVAKEASSLDERKYQLEVEKHARDRLCREDSRVGQALTWLFTSQALIGGSYAYMKQQIALAIERNLVGTWHSLNSLISYVPIVAVALCIVFLSTVLSVSKAQREIQQAYPRLSLLGQSWLTRSGPAAAAAIGILFSLGWSVVLFALP